jgi:hypothetical protein
MRLNKQPHRNQLGIKMIKNERDDMGKAEDMGVISQGRVKTRKENL